MVFSLYFIPAFQIGRVSMFENMDNWEFSNKILKMRETLEQEQEDASSSLQIAPWLLGYKLPDYGKC